MTTAPLQPMPIGSTVGAREMDISRSDLAHHFRQKRAIRERRRVIIAELARLADDECEHDERIEAEARFLLAVALVSPALAESEPLIADHLPRSDAEAMAVHAVDMTSGTLPTPTCNDCGADLVTPEQRDMALCGRCLADDTGDEKAATIWKGIIGSPLAAHDSAPNVDDFSDAAFETDRQIRSRAARALDIFDDGPSDAEIEEAARFAAYEDASLGTRSVGPRREDIAEADAKHARLEAVIIGTLNGDAREFEDVA